MRAQQYFQPKGNRGNKECSKNKKLSWFKQPKHENKRKCCGLR